MEKGKTLYLECYSGISGDMTVAALLDLGATEENLRETLKKIDLGGYHIQVSYVKKSGVCACDFNVILDGEERMVHTDLHEQIHTHEHRTWADIEKLLNQSDLKPRVLELAKEMFTTVAEAEGEVHGCPSAEVHFHEVGAVDSIIDIVSVATCLEELQVDRVLVSDIWEGQGHVECQHGTLPVPVPAVLEIVKKFQLTIKKTAQTGEMVTPTGAAIAALSRGKCPTKFKVKNIGIGAGKKNFPRANILRAMLIEEEE